MKCFFKNTKNTILNRFAGLSDQKNFARESLEARSLRELPNHF